MFFSVVFGPENHPFQSLRKLRGKKFFEVRKKTRPKERSFWKEWGYFGQKLELGSWGYCFFWGWALNCWFGRAL